MHQLTMIYNCRTIYYMNYLPACTSLINRLNEYKYSKHANTFLGSLFFTQNTSIDDLHRQKSIFQLDYAPVSQESVTLQEFAIICIN